MRIPKTTFTKGRRAASCPASPPPGESFSQWASRAGRERPFSPFPRHTLQAQGKR